MGDTGSQQLVQVQQSGGASLTILVEFLALGLDQVLHPRGQAAASGRLRPRERIKRLIATVLVERSSFLKCRHCEPNKEKLVILQPL